MDLRNNNGVTLLALTITIIVMLLITGTVTYNITKYIEIEKVNKLYNDIENLNARIEDYYQQYGELPVMSDVYCNKEELILLLKNNANEQNVYLSIVSNEEIINSNDSDEYYIIELELLSGLTLTYGYDSDYNTAKSLKNTLNSITTDLDELYIINKNSHQIYYPAGILSNNLMYYSYIIETDLISKLKVPYTDDNNNIVLDKSEITTISDFKIYGNSVQNGTPTLDAPVEIQSVGDLVTDEADPNYGKYKIPVKVSGKNVLNIDENIQFTRMTYYQNLSIPAGTYRLSCVSCSSIKDGAVGDPYIRFVNNEKGYSLKSTTTITLTKEETQINLYGKGYDWSRVRWLCC